MNDLFLGITSVQLHLLLKGVLTTLSLAGGGVAIGLVLGTLFGVVSSRRLWHPVISPLIRAYVFVIQGTPVFVQILLIYFALPDLWGGSLSPATAVLIALGGNSTAYIAQIVRGGINSIPRGQWEAAFVLGYSTPGTLWHIIFPQTLKTTLPALLNEVISLVKETSIVGAIGVCDVTFVIRKTVDRTMEPLFWYLCAALIYLVITSLLGMGARAVERSLEYDERH